MSEAVVEIHSDGPRLNRGYPVEDRDVRGKSPGVAQQGVLVAQVDDEQHGRPVIGLDSESGVDQDLRRLSVTAERDVLDGVYVAVGVPENREKRPRQTEKQQIAIH